MKNLANIEEFHIEITAEEKFAVTKDEFMKPYRNKVAMNDMVAENLKAKGMSEESINDCLQMIDEN